MFRLISQKIKHKINKKKFKCIIKALYHNHVPTPLQIYENSMKWFQKLSSDLMADWTNFV